jgi:dihydroxycyclohexadiene carboxylate dehydrogenase
VCAEGGSVLAVDRSPLVREVVEEIVAAGGKAAAFQATWRPSPAPRPWPPRPAAFKRIDVLINNVGGTIWAKPYEQYGIADRRRSGARCSPPCGAAGPCCRPW